MKKYSPYLWKISLVLIGILSIWGFFYFESSWTVRILLLSIVLIGVMSRKKSSEIIIVTILYLGLYDLYNIIYGLAIPLALITWIVFCLASFLFFAQNKFNEKNQVTESNVFSLYLVVIGLTILEIFLVMYLWPVEPKIKSLVISAIFYVVLRVFYLNANNMLNLKRTLPLIIVSLIILGAVITINILLGY